jgi:hypothetical protein
MADDTSLSILNAAQAISTKWNDFLTSPEVDCPVVAGTVPGSSPAPGSVGGGVGAGSAVGPGGTGNTGAGTGISSPPPLTCTSRTRFWNLSFDTDSNHARFTVDNYHVGNSYLLALNPAAVSKDLPGLFQVLERFGIAASNSTGEHFIDTLVNAIVHVQIDPDPTSRNALWLTAGQAYRSDIALTLKPKGSVGDDFGTAITTKLGLGNALTGLSNIKILVQRTCVGTPVTVAGKGEEWRTRTTYSLSFNLDASGFSFWITLNPTGVRFDMLQSPSTDWSNLTGLGVGALSGSKPALDKVLDNVQLVKLSAGVSLLAEVWWEVTAAIVVKRDGSSTPPKAPLRIFLDFQYPEKIFSGGLITQEFYSAKGDYLLPTYDPSEALEPPADPVPAWDLAQLSSKVDSLPPGLPTEFKEAEIVLDLGDTKSIMFSAILGQPSNPSTGQNTVPMPTSFVWDTVGVQATIASGSFSCSLSTTFTLLPSHLRPQDPPAQIGISVDYSDGDWLLSGLATDLNCGHLAEFFDGSCRDAVAEVLGKLAIAELSLTYAYDKQRAASSFLFTGIITLGELQLRLFYQYASSQAGSDTAAKKKLTGDDAKLALDEVEPNKDGTVGTNWRFECDLEASAPNATVKDILNSISDDVDGVLPDFIENIPIPQAGGREPVSIKVSKTASNQVLFVLRIMINSFAFSIIQASSAGASGKAKRILRFAVEAISLPQDVPLIGKPPLPFDELEYVWVNDAGGVNQSEVTALNDSILTGEDALLYKKTNSGDSTNDGPIAQNNLSTADQANISKNKNPDPTVLVPGHHFMVARSQACVLDHVFKPATRQSQNQHNVVHVQSALLPATGGSETSPSKGDVAFRLGPLSFSALSLQFKDTASGRFLALTFDATFAMGTLAFDLLGFGLDIPLPAKITLDSLSDPHQLEAIMAGTRPTLHGLALSFSKPPILIAGGFEHDVKETADGEEDIFLGAIGIGFPPYTFVGLGEYSVIKHAGSQYKSVFLYAKLDGRKYSLVDHNPDSLPLLNLSSIQQLSLSTSRPLKAFV